MNSNSHPKFKNTLFTSLYPFVNSSSLFPSHDRRIGLTVTCGYHPELKHVMVLVEEEQPSFISTSIGEYIEPEETELVVRTTCSQLAETCRKQAQELIEHADRLERLAKQNSPLIDVSKIDKNKDHLITAHSDYEAPTKKRNSPTAPTSTPTHQARISRSVSLDIDDI